MAGQDLADLVGLISAAEGEFLADLAAEVAPDRAIVELGSFKGQSTCYLASRSRAIVHSVDLWDLGGQRHADKYAAPEVFAEFERQTRAAGVAERVVAHKGSSVDVGRRWRGPLVGLLFIDALHTYGAVRADLHAWLPHTVEEAWVVFHDYEPRFPGVIRAVDEWLHGRDHLCLERIVAARRVA